MYEAQPLTSEEPKLKLLYEHPAPKGKRIYMVSMYGAGFIGEFHPELGVVAWCELPKLSKEQKKRLQERENK